MEECGGRKSLGKLSGVMVEHFRDDIPPEKTVMPVLLSLIVNMSKCVFFLFCSIDEVWCFVFCLSCCFR